MINFATLLTQPQVERTHTASLEILENVGLLVRNEKARSIFIQHGCLEQAGSQIIKFPPALVEVVESIAPMIGEAVRTGREIPGYAAANIHFLWTRPQVRPDSSA